MWFIKKLNLNLFKTNSFVCYICYTRWFYLAYNLLGDLTLTKLEQISDTIWFQGEYLYFSIF